VGYIIVLLTKPIQSPFIFVGVQIANFEILDGHALILGYLGNMPSCGGGAEDVSRVRVRCAWKKFRELSTILTVRGASLRLKGKIYSSCVRSNDICIYGSETWPMKVENKQRLEMTEWMMVRHICGVTLKHIKSCEELRQLHGIDSVSDVLRRTG